jgi:hypothetical protein
MATSTNYGWAEPDNTDLVTNGAQAIRTLGNAIDTSLWNSGYGQAAKNKFINANFANWQRGTSVGPTVSLSSYLADRFLASSSGDTVTYSQQTFTAGTAPTAGYESQYFARVSTTLAVGASNYVQFLQRVEDVRNFSNDTVTISYWAKADAVKSISIELQQSFGSGGSGAVNTFVVKQALTTSWARYSTTFAVPSVSGKTIGTGSYLDFRFWLSAGSTFNARTSSLGQQNIIFDTWGWQVEYGAKATPFQTASGGSIQGELAMCQRYYYRAVSDSTGDRLGWGGCNGTTDASVLTQFPVIMRIPPTALEQSGTAGDYSVAETGGSVVTCSAVPTFQSSTVANASTILTVASGLIGTRVAFARATNATAYLGWSAEL